jgi:hypothetical protein
MKSASRSATGESRGAWRNHSRFEYRSPGIQEVRCCWFLTLIERLRAGSRVRRHPARDPVESRDVGWGNRDCDRQASSADHQPIPPRRVGKGCLLSPFLHRLHRWREAGVRDNARRCLNAEALQRPPGRSQPPVRPCPARLSAALTLQRHAPRRSHMNTRFASAPACSPPELAPALPGANTNGL